MPAQQDRSHPPLSPTQGQPWLLASPLPACWPHGSLGPKTLGQTWAAQHTSAKVQLCWGPQMSAWGGVG